MRLRFYFSWTLAISPLVALGQAANDFPITPYVNGVTSIKDGFIEAGPKYAFNKGKDASLVKDVRLSVRLPFSDKETNTVTVDRSLQSWRGVLVYNRTKHNVSAVAGTSVSSHTFGFQGEYGRNQFKYYPTGMNSVELEATDNSYAGEVRYHLFYSNGIPGASQNSFQVRLRCSSEFKGADEVGVIGPANAGGVVTSTNMVVEAPSRKNTFSPALAYQYYQGAGKFSYTPAFYFDRKGGNDEDNPFVGGSGRYRGEFWVFYYPSGIVNVKIGLAPYFSIRAVGTDKLNAVEFGGQLSLKTSSNFLNFFD